MAENEKNRTFSTVYDGEAAGTLSFTRREDIEEDVAAYLTVLEQLKKDYQDDSGIVQGLREVEVKLNALRVSTENQPELQKKLASLIEVPIASGKTLRLDAFRKTSTTATLAGSEEYRNHLKKLVRNTQGNITHLLLTWPEDVILQKFLSELHDLDLTGDFPALKSQMDSLGKSPQLWHYTEKKKEFLLEWLRPFQEYFGKPIEELSPEELQASIQKVETLRESKLEEMTQLRMDDNREAFRIHNRTMHPVINGKNTDFWGSSPVRDEFIKIMHKLIARFSLNLEDRFLLFRSMDDSLAYVVGFSDDAFDQAVEMEAGKLGVYPHMKVFLKNQAETFIEVREEAYPGDSSGYYRALQTAVVPFLASMAVMLEFELSRDLKQAFDMWI